MLFLRIKGWKHIRKIHPGRQKGVGERNGKMKLKIPFEIMEVEGRTFAVPLEESAEGFGGVIRLSKTAAEIFGMLQEETDEESIVEHMSRRYSVPAEKLTADVRKVVTMFREKGLLD